MRTYAHLYAAVVHACCLCSNMSIGSQSKLNVTKILVRKLSLFYLAGKRTTMCAVAFQISVVLPSASSILQKNGNKVRYSLRKFLDLATAPPPPKAPFTHVKFIERYLSNYGTS